MSAPVTDDALAPIALVGFGRFGRALGGLLEAQGRRIIALDPHATVPERFRPRAGEGSPFQRAMVVLAVPVVAVEDVLVALRPSLDDARLVLDVSSVRAPADAAMERVLGGDVPWVGTHPLFGPSSIALGERPLRAVVCPNPLHPGAHRQARLLYESIGCRVIEEDADGHDRSMAHTHALAFFIAKGMLDVRVEERARFVPPSFQAMQRTIEAVRSDAGHLFYAIEHLNPHAEAARRELLDALERLHQELISADALALAREGGFEIPDLGDRAPELRETRELIDELDRDLVALIARRAELARRAGRIKGEQRLPVRDPVRERALLEGRRAWAREAGLDPDGVAGVFETLLQLSRGVQERGGNASGG